MTVWTLDAGSQSWRRRTRRTPVEVSPAERERRRLGHENRERLRRERERVAYQQFWGRR